MTAALTSCGFDLVVWVASFLGSDFVFLLADGSKIVLAKWVTVVVIFGQGGCVAKIGSGSGSDFLIGRGGCWVFLGFVRKF